MYRKNTASQYVYFCLVNATTGAALTGATVTAYRSLDAGAQASATGTTTELANGQYRFNLSQADTNGDYGSFLFTATNAVPVEKTVVFTQANPQDAAAFGLSRLDAAISSRMATYTQPTGFLTATFPSTVASPTNITSASGVTLAAVTHSGAVIPTVSTVTNGVTVTTNNDKTGYSLTQSFPSNFASLSVDVSGRVLLQPTQTGVTIPTVTSVTNGVTVSTNNDKTGYSLSQAFPTNFASMSIDANGKVLLQPTQTGVTIPTVTSITNGVTASTVSDKTGYSLTQAFPSNFSSLAIAAGTGAVTVNGDAFGNTLVLTNLANASQIPAEFTSATFASTGVFSTAALANAPAGGGGGSTDWTANERTAIRSILGIPTSGTTPTDPTVGILDEIRDKTALITTGTIASSIPVTASGQIDGPLVIGDDYLSANGRAFIWTVALPSAFVIATSTCKLGMEYQDEEGTYSFTVTGTVTDAGSGNVTLTFDVPRTTTGTLGPGWYRWSVEIASASGTEVTRVKSSHNKLVEWVEKQT